MDIIIELDKEIMEISILDTNKNILYMKTHIIEEQNIEMQTDHLKNIMDLINKDIYRDIMIMIHQNINQLVHI